MRVMQVLCAIALTVAPAAAQTPLRLTTPGTDLARALEVTGQGHVLSMFRSLADTPAPEGLSGLPVEALAVVNSNRPWGFNDGALWAARGVSGRLEAGARFRRGPLTLTLDPAMWFSQNAAFDTVTALPGGRSALGYPWSDRIDLPQQPGSDALIRITPGNTEARFDWRALTAGVGTQTMVWGPAARYPILMGSSSAGFPHVDLGLRPAATPIGPLEARVVWGRLSESAWFDTLPGNDHRLFAGVLFAWQPRWLPGLTLGAERVFYQTWTDSLGLADFFAIVQPFTKDALSDSLNPEGDDARDQMLSLTWRWHLPQSGFEVYGEWARNDHNRDWLDFVLEPDHSQAWTAGLQKVLTSGTTHSRVQAELLHGGRSATFQVRATPTYYTHHIVRQGYTQDGQILGAGPGPGSDAQYGAYDRFTPGGSWGLWVERIRWNDDDYYRLYGATRRREGHNVTLEAGARFMRRMQDVRVHVQASIVREWNRHFVIGNHLWNGNVQLGVVWDW